MRYLSGLDKKQFKGEVVLVRVDFNVEDIHDALRLEASLPTIKFLRERCARVVLLSHRGRPKRREPKESLKFLIPYLQRRLAEHVDFLTDIPDCLPMGNVFLIENLRFWSGEAANDKNFARRLANLGEHYVNDAFAVDHRANASITQLPKLLPSYSGLLLEKEIKTLGEVMKRPKQPLVLILGGAKVSDKLGMIKYFLPKTRTILLGGETANTFLAAKKTDIGRSEIEKHMLPEAHKLLKESEIITPTDWVMDKKKILDIGPKTIERFKKEIAGAATIIWNGPLGRFENPKFREGSRAIARAIASSKAFSVVGGGETTELILQLGLEKKFSFLSTGGGAMLEFLSGKKLPGVEALENRS